MSYQSTYAEPDEDMDDERYRTRERRMAMYSESALARAASLEGLLVGHDDFKRGLAALDRAFQLGRALEMPMGMRLVGPPGTGKSALQKYFRNSLPSSTLFEPGMGVLMFRIRKTPRLGHAVESILRALNYPFSKVTEGTLGAKRDLSIEALKRKKTRLLLIDEAHNLCLVGRSTKRNCSEGTEVTEYIREVMDEARVAVCLAGGMSLDDLRSRDEYLASRCSTRTELSDFPLKGAWLGLIRSLIERCTAFDLKYLDCDSQRPLLHAATGGNPRALKTLITEAVLVGVDGGQDSLDDSILSKAFSHVRGSASSASNPWMR